MKFIYRKGRGCIGVYNCSYCDPTSLYPNIDLEDAIPGVVDKICYQNNTCPNYKYNFQGRVRYFIYSKF